MSIRNSLETTRKRVDSVLDIYLAGNFRPSSSRSKKLSVIRERALWTMEMPAIRPNIVTSSLHQCVTLWVTCRSVTAQLHFTEVVSRPPANEHRSLKRLGTRTSQQLSHFLENATTLYSPYKARSEDRQLLALSIMLVL